MLVLAPLQAAEAANDLTDRFGTQPVAARRWHGLDFGPTFSLPLPTRSASREVIGLDVGVSCTVKTGPNDGIGASVAYHYWPASAAMTQAFRKRFREQTWNIIQPGSGTWGLEVIEYGGHLRFAAPTMRAARPWLRVGAGLYRVDPNISGYTGEAGLFWVSAPPLKSTFHLGGSLGVGAELFGGQPARMGLDASYHYLDSREMYGSNLQVLTLGAHVLFDWKAGAGIGP